MIGIELNAFDSLNDKSISIIDDTQRSITGAQKIDETTWEYFDQVTFDRFDFPVYSTIFVNVFTYTNSIIETFHAAVKSCL